ncbi:MAG TPA: hypothetical protein VN688_18535 [Gemmataceae bacterium]|nr:hypothetical protein [Gemmataceae bacterium]
MFPSLAFGWMIWTRHRLGLSLCAGYWLLMLILTNTLPVASFSPAILPFVFGMPCAAVFGYLVGILSIGLDARLESRESGFPARLRTLPLRTWSLVGWPMLWGISLLALAWLTLSCGVLRPAGIDHAVLIWLPALMFVVILAWLQALVWSPFPLPGLRLFIVGPLIGASVIVPQLLLEKFGIDEALVYGLLAIQLPAAYLTAAFGVSRARRGDVPHWEWPGWPTWLRWTSAVTVGRPFVSPARAQLWFEWRRCGFGFPLLTAGYFLLCLPMIPWFAQAYELVGPSGSPILPPLLQEIDGLWLALVGLLWWPLLMASACGLEIGRLPGRDRTRPLSSFLATRPISTAMLVRVKFETAALSTLASWGVLLLAVLLWFALGGKAAEMMASFDVLRQRHPPGPFWIGLALLIAGSIVLTWLRMVESLWLGMIRRGWATLGALLGFGSFIALIGFGHWLAKSPEYWQTFADLLPWLAALAVALKGLAAGWSLRILRRRDLVPSSALRWAILIWIALAGGLFGVLYWLLPRNMAALSTLVLGIVLLLPFTRLAFAFLALDWNRHR